MCRHLWWSLDLEASKCVSVNFWGVEASKCVTVVNFEVPGLQICNRSLLSANAGTTVCKRIGMPFPRGGSHVARIGGSGSIWMD